MLKGVVLRYIEKEAENKRVFSSSLNGRRHINDVITSDGKLFQIFAAVTGNARSLVVESRVSGEPVMNVGVVDQKV